MRRYRRAGIAVAGGALALSLVACQAGRSAQTSQFYSPVDGRNINAPATPGPSDPYIAVRGAIIVANATGGATLLATIRNKTDQPETLQSVTANNAPATIAGGTGGTVVIDPNRSVALGTEGAPSASWADIGVAPGAWTTLQLRFADAGNVTLDVLVVAQSGDYSGVGIPAVTSTNPVTSASPTPSAG
ncbi:MAG: hypothetical protein WAN48_01945 [Actinomycetes bacterium]